METKSLKGDLDTQYGMIYAKAISLIILDKNAPYIGHLPAFRRGQVGFHFLTSHKRDKKSAGASVMTPSSKSSLGRRHKFYGSVLIMFVSGSVWFGKGLVATFGPWFVPNCKTFALIKFCTFRLKNKQFSMSCPAAPAWYSQ